MTADSWSAVEVERWGMVNHVVPGAELRAASQRLAEKIAQRPQLAVKLVKQSVNAVLDAQGQWNALQTTFAMHQMAHAHNVIQFGIRLDPNGLPPKPRASGFEASEQPG